jgi:molecular chaperone DnaJ
MRGPDVHMGIRITFDEAIFGCEKEVEINFREECSSCHGSGAKAGTTPETCRKCNGKGKIVYTQQSFFGQVQNVQTCPDCRGTGKVVKEKCPDCYGTGYITRKKKIKVTIPAGVDNGMSVRCAGNGEPGTNGGERGDLLVQIAVSQHPVFKRQDTSIYSTVPVSFATAALGGPIRIKTVDGEVEYEVKAGTQTDTRVRLKGKGVPSLRNRNMRGDHYVTLVVQVPERLNEAQKEALKAFDAAMRGETYQQAEKSSDKKKKGLFK